MLHEITCITSTTEDLMRKILLTLSFFAAIISLSISGVFAIPFASQTIGGPTGLITVPTANIGWDGNDFALDAGYHYIKDIKLPKLILAFSVHLS